MAGEFSSRILALRKVEAFMGFWVPNQGQAFQESPGVCCPFNMAAFDVDGLSGLLLCTLQCCQHNQGRQCFGGRSDHHPRTFQERQDATQSNTCSSTPNAWTDIAEARHCSRHYCASFGIHTIYASCYGAKLSSAHTGICCCD